MIFLSPEDKQKAIDAVSGDLTRRKLEAPKNILLIEEAIGRASIRVSSNESWEEVAQSAISIINDWLKRGATEEHWIEKYEYWSGVIIELEDIEKLNKLKEVWGSKYLDSAEEFWRNVAFLFKLKGQIVDISSQMEKAKRIQQNLNKALDRAYQKKQVAPMKIILQWMLMQHTTYRVKWCEIRREIKEIGRARGWDD